MYTLNLFCFWHKMSLDKELNNLIVDLDLYFKTSINGRDWELSFPYHGGQVNGDCYSIIFGTVITDDDDNENYIDEIRNANEKDYINDYNEFITKLLIAFDEDAKICDAETNGEYSKILDRLKKFINTNKPEFYSVEVSS